MTFKEVKHFLKRYAVSIYRSYGGEFKVVYKDNVYFTDSLEDAFNTGTTMALHE